MTAVRALSSGVSGMLTNQLAMDVTANNLANINTPGFKGSRVSFANSLTQTIFNGSAPGTQVGGQNAQQVGLGTSAASIDVDMRQGSLNTTGRELDLAIQGEGFFEVTDGTRNFYTRVGSFGLDSDNNLVDLGTGYRVIGNTYNLDPNPDGTQSVNQIGVELDIPVEDAFPARATQEINFQGNLASSTPALQGDSLQSVLSLKSALTGSVATEDTLLSDLTNFNNTGSAAGTAVPLYIFGTKPDGEAYAGQVTVYPFNTTNTNGQADTVGDLITELNSVLVHGSERFGTMRLENGSLIGSAVGSGGAFSLFMGEDAPFTTAAVDGTIATNSTDGALLTDNGAAGLNPGENDEVAGLFDFADGATTYDYVTNLAYAGTSLSPAARGTMAQAGVMVPSVTVTNAGATTSTLTVQVTVNGDEKGSFTIPAADYTGGQTFTLPGYFHVNSGDVVDVNISGSASADDIDWDLNFIADSDAANLTNDSDGNGAPDLFEEDTSTDANAWVYANATNASMDWYRMRLVPETVATSIEVFDAQGGRHTVEARYFRIGTKTEPGSTARINSWDMIVDIPVGEGELIDDLVTGIEFDQEGRFNGSVGTTIHDTTLNATNFVGNPGSATIQIDWASTGTTDPATIRTDFGDNNSYTGLTGFGSDSTAAAVDQDGYQDGKLDNISVSAEGDITALYTNGISRNLAQIGLVTFRNPAGLLSLESNLWQQSTNSGTPTRRTAGNNAGFITSGSLESANVDIATEFANLITFQRGFQVSARVIQTTDQILEELANLTR